MNGPTDDGSRDALPGELCTCGRQATAVFSTRFGLVGSCGIADGGSDVGPCPFCSSPRKHFDELGYPERCPDYRLRPVMGGGR
ncbi:hypothetical protein [Actinocatenispora sera]|uniref:Uncharacterized protein n=1 Tax=Actinocatenispora sera TaxID=390989 RepID=A0A810KZ76_9ACTN|nr:hypothetical protein [Actinocatenispora sera]BCJ27955.1 hypothetical protein Asera_20630 [Actinocatenispora sera]